MRSTFVYMIYFFFLDGFSSGTDDGSVRFWRLNTGAGESFKAHENTVTALAAYRDPRGSVILASAGFEGIIVVWRAPAKDGLKQNTVSERGQRENVARLWSPGYWSGRSVTALAGIL